MRNNKLSLSLTDSLILDVVLSSRRFHPRLGVRKLYHRYGDDIRNINKYFGRDKLFTLLRNNDLLVKRKKQYHKTTNTNHFFRRYANKIKDIALTAPNQVWASDITYLRVDKSKSNDNGHLYLSLLTDMYSRKIVGWSLSDNMSVDLCKSSLKQALKANKDYSNLFHHSDRGSQYCCYSYTDILDKHNVKISMTEENHCYENALAERVNGILKDEYNLDRTFRNKQLAFIACKEAIKLYNNDRPHWALGLKTPEQVHKNDIDKNEKSKYSINNLKINL